MKKSVTAGMAMLLVSACVEPGFRCADPPWGPDCSNTRPGLDGGTGTPGGGSTNGGGDGGRNNNGFGNGDQDPPGNSADHNRAENDRDGRSNPSHGGGG